MIQITDNRVDLQKAFEAFKEQIATANMMAKGGMKDSAIIEYRNASETLLKRCTLPESKEGESVGSSLPDNIEDDTIQPENDIPEDVFGKMGELFNPNNNKL